MKSCPIMCFYCEQLKKAAYEDQLVGDQEVINKVLSVFFNTNLDTMVNLPPYPMKVRMYNVVFGFYQGYFKYSGKNIGEFHSALVDGKLHEHLMKFYKGKSSGYLTAVMENGLNFNEITNGKIVK